MWKGRSCLQGLLGCLFFSDLPHPKVTEHRAGVAVTICRAASSARAGVRHPGGSQELGCRDEEGLPGREPQGQTSFLAPSIGSSTPRPQEAAKLLVPICLWWVQRLILLCVHFRSRRKPRGGFAMVGTGSSGNHLCAHADTEMPRSHGTQITQRTSVTIKPYH